MKLTHKQITNEFAGQIILIGSTLKDSLKSFWVINKEQYNKILKDAEKSGYETAIVFHYEIKKKTIIDLKK